jgi:hypothetical protein
MRGFARRSPSPASAPATHSALSRPLAATPPVAQPKRGPSGEPLPEAARDRFEGRFGHDFSRVRIHAAPHDQALAAGLGARAFTIGRHIYFGAGEYAPSTASGQRLLAHELAHVVQQRSGPISIQRQPQPGQSTKKGQQSQQGQQGKAILPPPKVRGASPSPALVPICKALASPTAADLKDPPARARQFINDFMTALDAPAKASGATRAADVITNTRAELTDIVDELDATFNALRAPTNANRRAYFESLRDACDLKQREIEIELKYDILFENVKGEPPWATSGSYWDLIDQALGEIPEEQLFSRTSGKITFRREKGTASDPAGRTTTTLGSPDSDVQVFDKGATTSQALSSLKPGIQDVLVHEMGHVVDHTQMSTKVDEFLKKVVDWQTYDWALAASNWWTPVAAATPKCDAAAAATPRCRVCTDAGLVTNTVCDVAKLDTLLHTIDGGTGEVVMNGRTFRQDSEGDAGSFPTANVPPTGLSWKYARSAPWDYWAEVYKFAVFKPKWLHNQIPTAQIDWLKKNVFDSARHASEATREVSLNIASATVDLAAFAAAAPQEVSKLFTRQQMVRALTALASHLVLQSSLKGPIA